MKRKLLWILLLSTILAKAQTSTNSMVATMKQARTLLKNNTLLYNPQKAFSLFMVCAQQGNGEAMNALGLMYERGLGTATDEKEAIKWLEKSANKGYANAWFNLGSIYKTGIFVDQNFTKAYQCFEQGANLNSGMGYYGQGFMLYKGLGCKQSYQQAVQIFTKGIYVNDPGCMYMLGLCYRNGYGVAINTDSAKYWLKRSSEKGYDYAKEELASSQPENIDILNASTMQPFVAVPAQSKNIKDGYQLVKQYLPENDISGKYVGYAIKFDWSGKHVIGVSTVTLDLKNTDKTLTGEWIEDNNLSTLVDAHLADSAVVFNNTKYSKNDHYNTKSPNDLEFKNAHLQLIKNADTVFIGGSLQLWSTRHKEPEKPTYIMLTRTNTGFYNTVSNTNKTDSVKFIAYPNPFTNILEVNYTLKKASSVRITVTNLLNATVAYKGEQQSLSEGNHDEKIEIKGLPGTYIVTLNYGDQIKSVIVFKQ